MLQAAKTKFGLSFCFAIASNYGLILTHGGHDGLQKSTITPGVLLIIFCNYDSEKILHTSPATGSIFCYGAGCGAPPPIPNLFIKFYTMAGSMF